MGPGARARLGKAAGAGLLIVFLASGSLAAARPQGKSVPQLKAQCASLARFPTPQDPTGVQFSELDLTVAAPVCEAALAAKPGDAAVQANLARLRVKAKRFDEAFSLAAEAAKAGDPQAQNTLAKLYADGSVGEAHAVLAARWYRRAAEQGYAAAQGNLGLAYEDGEGVPKDAAIAVMWHRKAAAQGYSTSLARLGVAHEYGRGVKRDWRAAVDYYRRAAELGDSEGQEYLGTMYASGRGVAKDLETAVAYYRQAADQQNGSAQTRLGHAYEEGQGIAQDFAEARRWYETAMENDDDDAVVSLGLLYERGRGAPADPARAISLYKTAVKAGNTRAKYTLAASYEIGQSTAQDLPTAVRLYREAADEGDSDAQNALGVLYANGEGVPKDQVEAVRLYRLAVDQNHITAMANLAGAYRDGRGVARDPYAALALFREAVVEGSPTAKDWLNQLYTLGRDRMADESENAVQIAELYHRTETWSVGRIEYGMGRMYAEGIGAAVDGPHAVALFRASSAHGHLPGTHALAASLATGEGGVRDPREAVRLLEQAARRGHVESMAALAYPRAWLPEEMRASVDSAGWRAKLAALPTQAERIRAAFARVNDRLTTQDFKAALAGLDVPPGGANVELYSARVSLLIDMALYGSATRQFLAFTHSGAFQALPSAQRADFIRRFNEDIYVACGWQTMAKASLEDLKALHALGVTGAAYQLGVFYDEGSGAPEDPAEARKWYRLAADGGDKSALRKLAVLHVEGRGGPEDFVEARRLYQRAADDGDSWSQMNLGDLLDRGLGGERDAVGAVLLYQRSYWSGDQRAARWLANAYVDGAGVEPNDAEAARLLRTIVANNSDAKSRLGWMYETGRGVPKDPVEAVRWYRLAARDESSDGRLNLARALRTGLGAPRDDVEAARILRLAVEKGDRRAKRDLGRMVLAGRGVDRDVPEALRLFRDAADDGDRPAQIEIARLIARGEGTPKDVGALRLALAEAAKPYHGKSGEPRADAWLKTCEVARTVACFAELLDFWLEPDEALAGPAQTAPEETLEQKAAPLTERLLRAEAEGPTARSDFYRANGELELLYALHQRGDLLVETRLRRVMVDEADLIQRYGSIDNYFALISSSCHWGQASKVAYANGRSGAALFFAKLSVNRLQQARGFLNDLDDDLRECFLDAHKDRYRWLADLFMEMGRFPEAENVMSMLKDFELHAYTRDGKDLGASRAGLPLNSAQSATADKADQAITDLATAARLSDSLRKLGRPLTETETAAKARADEAVTAARRAFTETLNGLQKDVASLDETASLSQAEVKALPSMMTTIKARFGPKVAAVHAVVLPDCVHWLISTAGYQKAIRVDVKRADLNKAIGALRLALRNPASDAVTPARDFYALVFAPVDKELRAAGVEHVMLSLDGGLRYVPFAALNDGSDWLVRRYSFSAFRQSSSHMLTLVPEADWVLAGFGASKGGQGMNPLPEVPTEIRSIVSDPARRFIDERFTRNELEKTLRDNINVVHIATHFKLSPDAPGQSFLLLGDGGKLDMTAFETDGLRLTDVELLTLSACETALAGEVAGADRTPGIAGLNGAEVDGMAGLAQNAGARAVLASLWSVADESTAQLMQAFYETHGSGVSKAQALRKAQLTFLDKAKATGPQTQRGAQLEDATPRPRTSAPTPSHPFYWAPFVLVGNWL